MARKRRPGAPAQQKKAPPRKRIPPSRVVEMSAEEYNAMVEKDQRYRPNKFGAKKITIDGIEFDSTGEGYRYEELKTLAQHGVIRNLRLQVPYLIEWNGVVICKYVADFVYWDCEKRTETIEDFKGVVTREFSLKRKLMLACYGKEIKVTRRSPSTKARKKG